VAALGAGGDPEALGLGLLVGGEDAADADAVDPDGLLGEDVLARLDGGLEHHRPEAGRGGEDHHVDARVDHLLVGVEPGEAAVVGDVELALGVLVALEAVPGGLEVVGEEVAEGVDDDPLVARHRVGGGPGPPAAAADQADLERLAPRGVHERGAHQGGGAGDGGGRGQELAA